jgi:hypothetical protein
VAEGWLELYVSNPPNRTRRSELATEFQTAAAFFTWLNTEPKLSLGP